MKKKVNKCLPYSLLSLSLLLFSACSTTGGYATPPAPPVQEVTHTYQTTTTVQQVGGHIGTIQTAQGGPTLHKIHIAFFNGTDLPLQIFLPKTWTPSGWADNVIALPVNAFGQGIAPVLTVKPGKYGFFRAEVVAKDDEVMAVCFRQSYGFGGAMCRMKKYPVSSVTPAPPLWTRITVSGQPGVNGSDLSITRDLARLEIPRPHVGTIRPEKSKPKRTGTGQAKSTPAPSTEDMNFVP